MDMATIWWVRRDFRVGENQALEAARAGGEEPIVLYCNDPRFPTQSQRAERIQSELRELSRRVEHLVVESGDPVEVVARVAKQTGSSSVHISGEFGPYGRVRDEAVRAALHAAGVDLIVSGSNYLVEPGVIRNAAGEQMRTFSGYRRAWYKEVARRNRGFTTDQDLDPVVAGKLTELTGKLDQYPQGRDYPGIDATSRLSVELRFGTVHPGQVLAAAGSGEGAGKLIDQLCWREWYADNLWHDPHSAWRNGNARAVVVPCDEGERAERRFLAWCRGETGYPIVDAGMRQLNQTGWMHNRVRMITASFLVKDLHLPWQWGARYFLQRLEDGDLASNNLSWQWVAGCGVDASPYYRIFNPTAQGQRFDPEGEYVATWVSELAGERGSHLHQPGVGGYAEPIVDHAQEREEALKRQKEARRGG
jgi:deoxyribodipyrimidine photo-lyase